ncbi:VP3 [Meles meles polyomavirus 1]|nr:VP3 [Meles meles polyomavirus 1]AJG44387.1 VP3 [Meles meles polyomavirus 1]AJG44392.1 VP3 [Meles meles polyomavirus 1]
MALQVWMPQIDYLFPGFSTFARYAQYLDPFVWGPDLINHVSRLFWQALLSEGRRQIGYAARDLQAASRELATRTATEVAGTVQDAVARFFENTRWAVSHVTTPYGALQNYYRQLSPVNPPQLRQLERRLTDRGVDIRQDEEKHYPSAEYIEKYGAPGGAGQRHAPDWLLPLLLGLYGDLTPTWRKEIEEQIESEDEEDTPQKKRVKRSRPSPGAKATDKRRHRSTRNKNRSR